MIHNQEVWVYGIKWVFQQCFGNKLLLLNTNTLAKLWTFQLTHFLPSYDMEKKYCQFISWTENWDTPSNDQSEMDLDEGHISMAC